MNMIKGYRTVVVSILLGALTMAHGFGYGLEVLPEDVTGVVDKVEIAIGAVWGLVAIAMRAVTSTGIGKGK